MLSSAKQSKKVKLNSILYTNRGTVEDISVSERSGGKQKLKTGILAIQCMVRVKQGKFNLQYGTRLLDGFEESS